MQITLMHSISAFDFVVHNLQRISGKNAKLSRALGEKTESLYYNASLKSMLKITHKMLVYFLCRRLL